MVAPMKHRISPARLATPPAPLARTACAGAVASRLYYAQVREDPRLELEALCPEPHHTTVVISSGGCTALALLASSAGAIVAIDRNPVQNHLVELKLAALELPHREAVAFLGGWRMDGRDRFVRYGTLRDRLSAGARAYWDAHREAIRRGVLGAGVTERFVSSLAVVMRATIHPDARIRALLACATLDEQRAFYDRTWNNRRWRALFPLLLNRFVFRRTYDPAFFEHAEAGSFAVYFRDKLEHALTALPMRESYFLHYMLTGEYARDPSGLPAYLTPEGARLCAARRDRLRLVDGGITAYLESLPARSVDRFALSNVAEWMSPTEIDALFAAVARAAAPRARVCFRNFVGFTELPARFCATFVVDDTYRTAIARDRSAVQRRIVVCDVAA